MVQKHQMIADFEKVPYTPEMLAECWHKQINNLELLVKARWAKVSILDFIHF